MNIAEVVFTDTNLRNSILKYRTECMKKDYIKKIYRPWGRNLNTYGVYQITKPLGVTHVNNTLYVKWSIVRSCETIDIAPLLITDVVHDNITDEIYMLDGLVDVNHLILKKKSWYLTNDELHKFIDEEEDLELIEYYLRLDEFIMQSQTDKQQHLNKELERRHTHNLNK